MAHYSTTAVASSGMLSSSVSVAPPPPLRLTRAAYDDTEIHSLCDAVDQIRPRSHGAWMLVAQLHAQTYPDRNRHAESLNRQWAKTCRLCRTLAASPDALVDRPSYLQRVLDIQRRLKATKKNQQPLFVVGNNTIVTNNNHAVTATATATGINHASLNGNATAHPANNSNSGVNNYHQAPAENNGNDIALVQQQHQQQQQKPPYYAYANEDEEEDEDDDIDDDDDDDEGIEDEVVEAGEDVQANIQLNDNNSIEIRIRREEHRRYNILLKQEINRHDEELNRLTTKTVETIMNLYVKSMELFVVALAHGRR